MPPKGFRIKEVWLHVIGWLVFLILPISFGSAVIERMNIQMAVPRILLGMVVFYFNYLVLVPKLLLQKKILLYVVISISFLFLVNFLLVTYYSNMPGFNKMNKIMTERPNAELFRTFRYIIPGMVAFAFFLLGGTIGLVKDFYKRDKTYKEREIKKTEMELRFLKNQLNPHFLFNSLNSIYSLVRNKSDQAPEAVITVSELMRYMLYESNEEKLPLSKEIDYIKNYISLQRIRLLNSERVTISIKGDYENRKISPLLLISFIENAFKYGTDFKGITDIGISIEVKEDILFFKVDNIIGNQNKDEKSSGIGLSNIQNRLQLLYPDSHTLDIHRENGRYYVDLKLKLT